MRALVLASNQSVAAATEAARHYASKARAESTLRCYAAAWREFEHFAGDGALTASPQMVIAYLAALADGGAKVSTIGVKLAAVSFHHTSSNLTDPTRDRDVRLVMAGIRRTLGTHPAKKAPILLDDLRAMVAALDTHRLQDKRDKALLLLGWAGAFRRSELVALDVADLAFSSGVRVMLRRSKTDQEGAGMVKVIPSIEPAELDPARALRAWLDAAGIRSGPVFRKVSRWGRVALGRMTGRSVADIVKLAARRAGLDDRQFSGHSLRLGFVTAAALADAESRDIMAQTGHQSEKVMRGYIQDAGRGASAAVRAAFGCLR